MTIPTPVKKIVLLVLFMVSAAVVFYGVYFVFGRLSDAHEVTKMRHILDEDRKVLVELRETIEGAIKGYRLTGRANSYISKSNVTTYDPEVVAALKQEGIDVEDINDIRVAMRDVYNHPDEKVRQRAAARLYRVYGLEPDPKLLGRLEKVEGGMMVKWTRKGKAFIKSIGSAVGAAYEKMTNL